MARKKKRRIGLYILGGIILAIVAFVVYYNIVVKISPPTSEDPAGMGFALTTDGSGLVRCDNSWMNINEQGLGEIYIEGNPLELGVLHGLLLQEEVQAQEDAFVEQIKVMIPSESYLKSLKYFLAWFNKDLDEYIKQEYLLEIYGISAFASDNYGFIGPKYDRILNYHAAHDIGHALQNMSLVKCTAFGAWDGRTADSAIYIGRNFDFYVGDDFAKQKFIAFIKPEQGYKFAHITWAGMIGVVSGMNEKGLTITLNSAKSDIPFGARTPVSIIAREILQYASNIEEAMQIARARESFVSESFLIGSAADHKVVVLEKSIDTTILYDPGKDHIILTNHFQSEYFMEDPLNIENIDNETSLYRHERVQELLSTYDSIDQLKVADILRDRKGKGGKDIGNGNEKAINQLIAHHSIIFTPEEKRLWISTGRFQQRNFLCYDLDSVFADNQQSDIQFPLFIGELNIPPNEHFGLSEMMQYELYKGVLKSFQQAVDDKDTVAMAEQLGLAMINYNPEYYLSYYVLGKYFQQAGDKESAAKNYRLALSKEVSSAVEREGIYERLEECIKED